MKLKYFFILLSLSALNTANALQRNLCDDLVDSETSTPLHINKCHEKFGISEHYKAQQEKEVKKVEDDKTKEEQGKKNKDNLEIKKFSQDDLFDAGFGKPFISVKISYRNRIASEEALTKPDALCAYLGYEKAIDGTHSTEYWENKTDNNGVKVDMQGLVIDTNFLGKHSKTPEIYRDKEGKYAIRKYTEISCVKRKNKDMDGSQALIDAIKEVKPRIDASVRPVSKDESPGVNNTSRSNSKPGKTPNAYTPPDWAKNDVSR